MEQALHLKEKAKRTYDLSPVGWELGFTKNNCGNFSLLPMADGNWFCHIRIFAYWIDSMGRYCTNRDLLLSSPHVPQFCILDRDFNFIRKVPTLQTSYWRHPVFNTENPYLEDGRMVMWNNKPYMISTVCYLKDGRWNAAGLEVQEIQLCFDGVNVKHFWNSIENGITGLQKNWMPISDRPFNYVANTSTDACQWIDIQTGEIREVGKFDQKDLYRGNTPLVKIDDGYVAITHKVDLTTKVKTYTNYLVKYGNDMSVQQISRPFKLTNSEIEFVTVMQIVDDEIIIGVTTNDDTPEVQTYDVKNISDILENM